MKDLRTALLFLSMIFIIHSMAAQNVQMVHIKLKNGNTIIGQQLSENDTTIVLQSEGMGKISIEKNSIKTLKKISPSAIKNEEYWFENPNASRYLFAPSGYSLKAGEGYYQNFMLFYNSFGYGFSDRFTAGLGIIPVTFGEGLFFTFKAKYAIPLVEDKWNVGTGFLYSSGFGDKLGIGYGVLTYGTREHNVTIGAGYGWTDGDIANRPIITISGMTRLGKKLGLVSENWLIPKENYTYNYDPATGQSTQTNRSYKYDLVYGLSLRFIGNNISIDLGVVPIDDIAIPIVGVIIPFGRG